MIEPLIGKTVRGPGDAYSRKIDELVAAVNELEAVVYGGPDDDCLCDGPWDCDDAQAAIPTPDLQHLTDSQLRRVRDEAIDLLDVRHRADDEDGVDVTAL